MGGAGGLTDIGPEAQVTSPMSSITEGHIRINISPTNSTPNNDTWINNWTSLQYERNENK